MTFSIESMMHHGSPWWTTCDGNELLVKPAQLLNMPDGLVGKDAYLRGDRIVLLGLQWDLTVAATIQYLFDQNGDGSQTAATITTLTGQGAVNDLWIPLQPGHYDDTVPVTNVVQPASLDCSGGTGRVLAWGIITAGTWACAPNRENYAGSVFGAAPLTLLQTTPPPP